jgi:hypothetical protein
MSCASTRRDSIAGAGDYIFSFIKTRRHDAAAVLPDRSQVTMEQPCMRAYTQLTVRNVSPSERTRDRRHGGADSDSQQPRGE